MDPHVLFKPVGLLTFGALLLAVEGAQIFALLLGVIAIVLASYAVFKTFQLQKQSDQMVQSHARLVEDLRNQAHGVEGDFKGDQP